MGGRGGLLLRAEGSELRLDTKTEDLGPGTAGTARTGFTLVFPVILPLSGDRPWPARRRRRSSEPSPERRR